MSARSLKIAGLIALSCCAVGLSAGQDWAYLKAPRVAEPGHGLASLGLSHSVEQTWALGDRFAYLRDSNGAYREQRRVSAEFDLAWQMDKAWGLKLDVPYVFSEVSDLTIGTPYYRLDDPSLRRVDSLGDLSLELRRGWGAEPFVAGASATLSLGVVGPSGVGPFEAPHPLAATGSGRWQIEPGFVVGISNGSLSLIAQAIAPIQFGRESVISSDASLGYGAGGPNLPAGGNVWLGPRYGVQAGLGLGWQWYAAEDSRQCIAIELQAWQRSPLDQGGVLTPDTEQAGLRFIPQLQADYGRFHALAGWELPFLYAYNEAASDFGGSHLRVDYGF